MNKRKEIKEMEILQIKEIETSEVRTLDEDEIRKKMLINGYVSVPLFLVYIFLFDRFFLKAILL